MRKWAAWGSSGRFHLAGLTDQELARITVPALIVPGSGGIHPRSSAEKLHKLLPKSEWMEPSETYSSEDVRRIQEGPEPTQKLAASLPAIEAFLRRVGG